MSKDLSLRPAQPGDSRMIWQWANDAEVRRQSFSSDPIPWPNHQAWYAAKLADDACTFHIVLDGLGVPVGQVRFDRGEAPEMVISVSIAPERRGGGMGAAAIQVACRALLDAEPSAVIVAYIRSDNLASQRAFSRAGFDAPVPVSYQGQRAVRQTLVRRQGT